MKPLFDNNKEEDSISYEIAWLIKTYIIMKLPLKYKIKNKLLKFVGNILIR